jgi:Family of unknown function (DUF5990)
VSTRSAEILLRIIVVNGPQDVAWAVQLGRTELLLPAQVDADGIAFDFTVGLAPSRSAAPRFTGSAVQGKTGDQFVYVGSGKRAGQASSCWDRRAKVSLMTISTALLAQQGRRGGVLRARFFGVARDGGPACASVPLLDAGWQWVGREAPV